MYELPFGQGKRFGSGVGDVMERLVGGWQVSGTCAHPDRPALSISATCAIVGMTEDEARAAFRHAQGVADEIYLWPQDIIDNTIKAYSRDINGFTRGTPTGRYFAPANYDNCIETITAATATAACARSC